MPVDDGDWQGTSDDAMAELLRTLVEAGGFEKLVIWTASLPAAAKESLWAAGFQPLEEATERSVQSPVPIIRKLGGEKDPATWRVGDRSALNIANWDLRAIYSDSY